MKKPRKPRQTGSTVPTKIRLGRRVVDGIGLGRSGGGKLARSEVVTVRLDPRLRYLADLVARRQRRTLSSFIEWTIEESLAREKLKGSSTAMESSLALWDVEECDRFVKLALFDESLLSYREQILWKYIQTRDTGIRARDQKKIDWEQLRVIWDHAPWADDETGE